MTRGAHTPDCFLVQYADIPDDQLQQPRMCDCDGMDDVAVVTSAVTPIARIAAPADGLTAVQTRALNVYRKAEREYRAAKTKRDEALAAFTEAVVE